MDIVEDIVIVGAGIAGLATSLGLHRLGLRSLVLESSDGLRTEGFAISLWTNAWRALDALGVGHHLRERSARLQGYQLPSAVSGRPTFELGYGNHEPSSVKRQVLLETLKNELPKGTIRYSSKVVSIEESGNVKVVQLENGCTIRAKVLIGCDGVNSVVAKCIGLSKPIDTGRSAMFGLIDYPEDHGLNPKAQAYHGGGIRLGIVPCDDKSIHWFCTISPSVSHLCRDMAQDPVKLKEFIVCKSRNISSIPEEATNLLEKTELDSISLVPLRFRLPWDILVKDITRRGICVAGDALHPMTPDIGQGACSALEDSVVLARCIGDSFLKIPKITIRNEEDDIEIATTINKGLENFAKMRKWRSFSLIATAYLVGFLQESENKIISFLRKNLEKHVIASTLKIADFDCGKLSSD